MEESDKVLFVLTTPTSVKYASRNAPDSWELRECDIKLAIEMQQFGFMYIDDNGHGPFYIDDEKYAKRYLHYWPVFKKAPPDGHICDYKLSYGKCSKCASIAAAELASKRTSNAS